MYEILHPCRARKKIVSSLVLYTYKRKKNKDDVVKITMICKRRDLLSIFLLTVGVFNELEIEISSSKKIAKEE